LSFGLQHVDYTQWKTKSKARKVTEIFVVFRHFCQKACPGYHIYAKLKTINAYFVAHGPGRMPAAGAKFYSKEELFAR
jgi:hypothetical protein